jgi:hypothetical protein
MKIPFDPLLQLDAMDPMDLRHGKSYYPLAVSSLSLFNIPFGILERLKSVLDDEYQYVLFKNRMVSLYKGSTYTDTQ